LNPHHRRTLWIFALAAALVASLAGPYCAAGDWEQGFRQTPDADKPWAYWWWLNANVTRQSITRDLEEMKAKGMGGFLLFDVTAYGQQHVASPPRRLEFMSPPWREMVKWAMAEAERVGLQMSINLSTCGGALRAPWNTGEQAPKTLLWTSADVAGPGRITGELSRPQGPQSWDAALLAARIGDRAGQAAAPGAGAEIRFDSDLRQWRPVALKPD